MTARGVEGVLNTVEGVLTSWGSQGAAPGNWLRAQTHPTLSPGLRMVLTHAKFGNQGVMVRWPRGTLDWAASMQRWEQEPKAEGGEVGSEGVRREGRRCAVTGL